MFILLLALLLIGIVIINGEGKKIESVERNYVGNFQPHPITSSEFSGVYIPSNLNAEYFSGALLIHISRLMKSETLTNIYSIRKRGIEQVLLAILFYNKNVMTRDYFDFQVDKYDE